MALHPPPTAGPIGGAGGAPTGGAPTAAAEHTGGAPTAAAHRRSAYCCSRTPQLLDCVTVHSRAFESLYMCGLRMCSNSTCPFCLTVSGSMTASVSHQVQLSRLLIRGRWSRIGGANRSVMGTAGSRVASRASGVEMRRLGAGTAAGEQIVAA